MRGGLAVDGSTTAHGAPPPLRIVAGSVRCGPWRRTPAAVRRVLRHPIPSHECRNRTRAAASWSVPEREGTEFDEERFGLGARESRAGRGSGRARHVTGRRCRCGRPLRSSARKTSIAPGRRRISRRSRPQAPATSLIV